MFFVVMLLLLFLCFFSSELRQELSKLTTKEQFVFTLERDLNETQVWRCCATYLALPQDLEVEYLSHGFYFAKRS